MSGNKRLGRWLLYILCLTPAVVMLGYYWFAYIPSQHEYFMNLRFRSIAMIGDHLQTKVDRLASSFNYAMGLDGEGAQSRYIAALVPDLTYPAVGCGPLKPGKIEFGNSDTLCFYPDKGNPAEALISRLFTALTQDELFDDVLVADSTGRVLYQRSGSSPRIVSLSELLKTTPSPKPPAGEAAGIDADAVRTVRLDDSEFALLVQPARIIQGQTLQICGLVRSSRLAQEVRHVPPQYLLLLFMPLLIVFLSSPLLKILLVTRTGRLGFHDMTLLALFTVIAAAVVTLLLVSGRQYSLEDERATKQLNEFATALNKQILYDLARVRCALGQFDDVMAKGKGQVRDLENLAGAVSCGKSTDGLDPFDFMFWANADGCQVAKWTTANTNTRRVNQTTQDSFKNVVAGRLWSLENAPSQQFTVQTLLSETTSRLIVVMAMPSRAAFGAPCLGHSEESKIVSAALVAQLHSLSLPLVPPGAGFAVFEPDGRVLFHSRSERNLHENLFEEIRSPESFRSAVAMRAELSEPAYYRGRKFLFHVQPVKGVAEIPWSIAVFQELEPRQAMVGRVWGDTLMLFGLLLGLIGVEWLVVIAVLRVVRGLSWRRQVDFFLARLWPGAARKPIFRRLAWELGIMTLVSLALVIYGSEDAYRSAGWMLPFQVDIRGSIDAYRSVWLVPFCVLVPVAAMFLVAWRLRKPEPASATLLSACERQTPYFICLSLCLVLLGVVPTLGFWNACQAHEVRQEMMLWQQNLVRSMQTRRSQVRANIESSRALSPEAKEYFLPKAQQDSERDERNYVTHFWGTRIGTAAVAKDTPCQWDAMRGSRLAVTCASSSGPPLKIESTLPSIAIGVHPFWGGLALALLGIAYAWNCLAFGRLFLLSFRYSPLPLLNDLPSDETRQNHLLVLGLPLARKDRAVRRWLGYTPPRVNLYNAHFSKGWFAKTTALLKRELTAAQVPVMQIAAVGATAQAVSPSPPVPWVHISNLDAKLSEAADRQVAADLIEELVMMEIGETPVRLIVTSAVDPVFHFDSVLSDERKKIYEHPLPEPELQRLARLLHNFRKVQAPLPEPTPPAWAVSPEGEIVYQECRAQLPLLEIGAEVVGSAPPGRPRDVLLDMVGERALALYKLYWSSCTRSEKLLLIQLAQTGFVNPLCLGTLEDLIRKGLVLPDRRPCIMNETFRQFLEKVEGPDTVAQWESEAGESSWPIIRNIVVVLIVLGLAVVGVTQYQMMQTATAVLTGIITMLAGFSRLFGYLTGRRADASAATS